MEQLKDEGERWMMTVEDLKEKSKYITGDVFISVALISYAGAFTGYYRSLLF